MTAAAWQQRYLHRFYHGRPGWVDGTRQFHALIAAHVPAGGEVLELGPGPANSTSTFLAAHCTAVDGLDVDPDAATNPALRTSHLLAGPRWPLPDAGYDGVVANYVLEHVADPAGMATEAFRVLKPGGTLLFRTPNLWHYISDPRVTQHNLRRIPCQKAA